MADASIFQQYLQPPKSVMDYSADMDRRDLLNAQLQNTLGQNALQAITRQQAAQQAQQAIATQNAIQAVYSRVRANAPGGNVNPADVENGLIGDPLTADRGYAMRKERLAGGLTEGQTAEAQGKAAQAQADAASKTQAAAIAAHDESIKRLQSVSTPQDFSQWAADGVKNGGLDFDRIAPLVAQIQQDPTQFQAVKDRMLAQGVAIQERFKQAQETARSAATNATSLQTTGMNNATSRANNAANIGKDLLVAGIDNTGKPIGGTMDSLVDMLGQNRLNPTLALQRLTAPQRAAIVSQVQAKYPGWDETTYDAKKGAALKFTSGDLGNALRSVSTANAHLDQLGELADAMNNGNSPVVNKVQNWFATQSGQPNITNFDAIKAIVGQEVVKAIVAGGGTGNERDEAKAAFDNAKSPAQLKGAIQHYRAVMGAQATNLLEQRRAAGLPDSTLPNYSTGAAAAPSNSVTTPDGQVHTFPTADAAAKFKAAAGIK
jgi:hypothetical protein